MVRVSLVCCLRATFVLGTLLLLGIAYASLYAKNSPAYLSSPRDVASGLKSAQQGSLPRTEASFSPAVHQRRRPPPNYSVKDMAFDERMKFQKGEVDSFCSHYNYTFPTSKRLIAALNRHILVHEDARVLFCFVPKSGCTTLKILFYVSQGLLPQSEVTKDKDSVDQLLLEDVMVRASFMQMTPEDRIHAINTYFKFVMYRNPLERMVSVYRSKLSRWPLLGLKRDIPHFNWVRRHIYKYSHPEEYKQWEYDRGVVPKNVSFEDFVLYLMTDPMELRVDEHFASTFELCSPCGVKYDYYGNFNTFEEDAAILMKKIHASPSHLRHSYYLSNDTTQVVMGQYFNQLSTDLKRKVLNFFAKELHFYYRLFPEEAGSHKDILGLEDDLPPL